MHCVGSYLSYDWGGGSRDYNDHVDLPQLGKSMSLDPCCDNVVAYIYIYIYLFIISVIDISSGDVAFWAA